MTYQPPPPPPPGTPPVGPGGRPGFDPKMINPLDWAAVGAGVLAFIFSFISFYTADVGISGCPASVRSAYNSEAGDLPSASAWHGFFGWFGVLLALVGAGLIAVSLLAPQVSLPVPARLAALGAFAVATLSEILALFITPGGSYSSGDIGLGSCRVTADVGHGFGYWATLIVVIAGLVVTLMRFQATGGQLPGGMGSKVPNIGGYGPQGGLSGSDGGPRPGPGMPPQQGYAPPPQQGYNPPPQQGYNPPPPPPPGAPPNV